MDNKQVTTTKQKKLNPKQRAFIENYLSPESETFANLYRSGLKAGFSPTYSMNIKHLNPSWLSNTIEQQDFQPEHIKQGIQKIALFAPDSKSPDDTRLKAYETLAKITGMMNNDKQVNVTLVQPILSGASVPNKPKPTDTPAIDIDV
jgi:hypothetical protein